MKQNIFDIKTEEDFRTACLATFRYQYENLKVYRKFVDYLNINPSSINQVSDIPFLPIEMLKIIWFWIKMLKPKIIFKVLEQHK